MPDDRYPNHYILVGRTPIAVDLLTWADWFEKRENRSLWYTVIDEDLRVSVSTIFLGLDHSFSQGKEEPVLFETMSFVPAEKILLGRLWDRESDEERRYCTYAQAEAGHAEVVAQMRGKVERIKATAAQFIFDHHHTKR
jgi:hypothetical protein